MEVELNKRYNFKEVEQKWYDIWSSKGYFNAKPNEKKPFTIVIPPPNVTDVLHLGHALNNTIQDILIRYHRMKGYNAEWLPGTDHAGIATEVIVEKEIIKDKKEKVGKENFLKIASDWAETKRSIIIQQLKHLGCSCDWARERWTFDESHSHAVRHAFVHLYKKGLIYKGDYIINWCPRCKTALSDEEVEHKEINSHLYYIKYPFADSNGYITVATTRPETMLGDTACAVNPEDERYKKFIGKKLLLPLMNREIPIIADKRVDIKFGTGVVKTTPAHDPIDFEIAKTHNLPIIIIMDNTGKINKNGAKYEGLDRFEARKKIIDDLKAINLLEKIENYSYAVGHCYRCNTIIEPVLSKQWFVRMKDLAKPAIKAVEDGVIKFYPEKWTKVYLNWMFNIRDWCISRQIWWSHRIPVWYCENNCPPIVETEKPKVCPNCKSKNLVQEEDVLDTWFSSWLWPFSTFGWPEKTKELEYFYPTDVLVTAPEIIFFWVARMIMAGYEFIGKPPFTKVYIHGTVRDAMGRKMSKSLGNGIDPEDIIKDYGADALRFSLITAGGEGEDPHISKNTFELGRNFANKIWNAYRLITMLPDEKKEKDLADNWILSRLYHLITEVTNQLDNFKFYEPAMRIYEFFWHELCDWYLEILKIKKTKGVSEYILDNVLRLLHPFMPFITEEIWQKLPHQKESIMISEWPKPNDKEYNPDAEKEFSLIKEIITFIRNKRTEFNIPKNVSFPVYFYCNKKTQEIIKNAWYFIKNLANVKEYDFPSYYISKPGIRKILSLNVEIEIPIDTRTEKYTSQSQSLDMPIFRRDGIKNELTKLQKEKTKVEEILQKNYNLIKDDKFLTKAPKEVVERTKEKIKKYEDKLSKIKKYIKSLSETE